MSDYEGYKANKVKTGEKAKTVGEVAKSVAIVAGAIATDENCLACGGTESHRCPACGGRGYEWQDEAGNVIG